MIPASNGQSVMYQSKIKLRRGLAKGGALTWLEAAWFVLPVVGQWSKPCAGRRIILKLINAF